MTLAHQCESGTYRPYPSVLCSACRTAQRDRLSMGDLCAELNSRLSSNAVAQTVDKRDYESRFLKTISEGLRHAIRDHGPITKESIGSAAKRIYSRLRGTKYESVIQDYNSDLAIGKDWLRYKDAAGKIVARIADNDCLTCKHWQSDAIYAIAVELAISARAAAATTPAPQLHWPFAAKHPNCAECDREYEVPLTAAPVSNRQPHAFQEHPLYPNYCAYAVGDEDYCKRETDNVIHRIRDSRPCRRR